MKAFTLVKTKMTIEEVTVNTYGLERGHCRIEDISTDKKAVEEFIEKLNAVGDVSDCHIMELVEDEFCY